MNSNSPRKRQSSGTKQSCVYKRPQNHDMLPQYHESSSFAPPSISPADGNPKNYTPFDIMSSLKRKEIHSIPVHSVDQLHHAVLDRNQELRNIQIESYALDYSQNFLRNHDVLDILSQRFHSGSSPGNRKDNATVALAMEGGGMRGCVSAGMAAALASLGLMDSIDKIYGSSAGSVVGSYMVSRQMCLDVYIDILPLAKKKFVCKKRFWKSTFFSILDVLKSGLTKNAHMQVHNRNAGMNISYVLDGIMGGDQGIRPLDMKKFQENDKKQPLRVVASGIDSDGQMQYKCLGTREFFGDSALHRVDGTRSGFWACLEAGMNIPGATGSPIRLFNGTENRSDFNNSILTLFDAFCFESIPYRSAVDEGATHVLVMCSRPDGFEPVTKPGIYEKGVAPLYFHSHGHSQVAKFFQDGGQQYLYAEDMLILEKAKLGKVSIPPPKILYGTPRTPEIQRCIDNRGTLWKEAHLFPMKVPKGTPACNHLEQEKDAVLEAVRGGFSAAFDILAPTVGLELGLSGKEAAQLVFPEDDKTTITCDETFLQTKVSVPGESIEMDELVDNLRACRTKSGNDQLSLYHPLLSGLPGFRGGRLQYLAKDLQAAGEIFNPEQG